MRFRLVLGLSFALAVAIGVVLLVQATSRVEMSSADQHTDAGARPEQSNSAQPNTATLSSTNNATAQAAASNRLTIYASLPMQGVTRPESADILRSIGFALDEIGSKIGKFNVRLVPLDNVNPGTGRPDEDVVARNAQRAVNDKTTIAYIGEASSGTSMVSMPILNRAGILQLSHNSTYVGLTSSKFAAKGEPQKYFPTGKRTFGRVVPTDRIQAPAMVNLMKQQECKSIYLAHDGGSYGEGIAQLVSDFGAQEAIRTKGLVVIDRLAENYEQLGKQVSSSGADCFFFGGVTKSRAADLFTDVFEANEDLQMFGPDGLADFLFPTGLPAKVRDRTFITFPALDPDAYPETAQRFFRQFEFAFAKTPEPYTIFGYETTLLILDAIRRAGAEGNNRGAVVKKFFATKNRKSVLGKYSIDKRGDTTLTDYGAYRIVRGSLEFWKKLKVD